MKIPNGFNGSLDLECPRCGGNYMHQGEVDIYFRAEDAATGNHVCINPDSTTIDTNVIGNPSTRRHGMTIDFECENCPEKLCLAVVQHKGQTFIYWL